MLTEQDLRLAGNERKIGVRSFPTLMHKHILLVIGITTDEVSGTRAKCNETSVRTDRRRLGLIIRLIAIGCYRYSRGYLADLIMDENICCVVCIILDQVGGTRNKRNVPPIRTNLWAI